jgi:hypothetical protein
MPIPTEEQKQGATREEIRATVQSEINRILAAYGCMLTAHILITPEGNIPQVLLIDAPTNNTRL